MYYKILWKCPKIYGCFIAKNTLFPGVQGRWTGKSWITLLHINNELTSHLISFEVIIFVYIVCIYLLLASGGLPEAYPRCLPVKILALRILLFLSHSLFICGTWRINKIWCCTANIFAIPFDIDIFLWFFLMKGFSPIS